MNPGRPKECCECKIPASGTIMCPRHNVRKGSSEVFQCQNREDYFFMWEMRDDCASPKARKSVPEKKPKTTAELVGVMHGMGRSDSRSLKECLSLLEKCKKCPTYDATRTVCSEDKGCGAKRVFTIRILRRDCEGWSGDWPRDGRNPSPRSSG